MSRYDIVYVLKNDYEGEELKYSLRSVVMNFPYRKIVFVGGCPSDIEPDIYISHEQIGSTKWDRSMASLKVALNDNRLTDDIWLFNDDFFVMDRMTDPVNYFGGSLEKKIIDARAKVGNSSYVQRLDICRGKLLKMNKDTLSFALHVPMLVNRAQALSIFDIFPNQKMFRSLYGNYYKIDCQRMDDVKVTDLKTVPDTRYISTSDEAFSEGRVGEFLRRYFIEPSKYESLNRNSSIDLHERYDEEGDIRYE